jgi:sec-independent protein translocase protein TatB
VFNFQGSELMIILLLALVVLGPEKLPEAMRRFGKFYGDLKRMSSGFQQEFKAVVDEPMRELRDTANTLRDSVDFRKLQDGERDEKPKSAEMAPVDPDVVPTEDVPFQPPEHPPPPAPFSSSQSISAAPRPGAEPATPAAVEPPADPAPRQIAVDDEHGLRESRPAAADGPE